MHFSDFTRAIAAAQASGDALAALQRLQALRAEVDGRVVAAELIEAITWLQGEQQRWAQWAAQELQVAG